MDALSRAWSTWSDTPLVAPGAGGADVIDCRFGGWGAVWVSDLDLRSVTVSLRVRRRDDTFQPITLSAALGSLTLRCDEPAAAIHVGPLLRLAAYCGIGGMTGKGFGVTRVKAHRRPVDPAATGGPGPVVPEPVLAGHGSPG